MFNLVIGSAARHFLSPEGLYVLIIPCPVLYVKARSLLIFTKFQHLNPEFSILHDTDRFTSIGHAALEYPGPG